MNDIYNIENNWKNCKSLCVEFENDLVDYILKGKIRHKGVKIRVKSIDISKKLIELKSSIVKQRQDYKGDYS